MTLKVYVNGIGIFGPGLEGWDESRAILAGNQSYAARDVKLPQPACLPPMERRRASASVRLGTHVALEALGRSGLDPEGVATVFASADGDTEILNYLCESLAGPDKLVSPTRFHNSVHNAPSGYWSIGVHSQAASTSLSCYDATFSGGLLEAACQAVTENRPVLLSAYDIPVPEPLGSVRRVWLPFGVSLVLDTATSAATLGRLVIDFGRRNGERESSLPDSALETVRRANPAARALPVLGALAVGGPSRVVLDYSVGTAVSVAIDG